MDNYPNTDLPVVPGAVIINRVTATPILITGIVPNFVDYELCDCTAGAITRTLPPLARSYVNGVGRILGLKKIDVSANGLTIKANAAELIESANTKVLAAQWNSSLLLATASGWVVLSST
jgi:hypothetical protein